MTKESYWTRVSYGILQRGDIIKFSGESHIVMITYFDGTTYGYSGHTNDRKNYTIKLTSSTLHNFYRVG